MHNSHSGHQMETIKDRLYVLDLSPSGFSVESYNPELRQWTEIHGFENIETHLSTPVVLNDIVYLVVAGTDGGNSLHTAGKLG